VVNVPAGYQSLLQQMSTATGLPYSVEAAQANAESGFSATAVSSAGAEGWLQFLPSTYQGYATQAGVGATSEFDPASEAKVYDLYMQSLLKQYKGNIRNSLAAYNAGPGNLPAGYGYADSIMAAAGVASGSKAGTATTTGINIPNPFGGLTGGLSVSGVITDAIDAVLKTMGLGSMKDLMERAGLLILGFVLVIVGIRILAGGSSSGSSSSFNNPPQQQGAVAAPARSKEKQAGKAVKSVGAEDAIEAAAVA
jgi:hypothetical protein